MDRSPQEHISAGLAPLQRVIAEMGRLGLVPEAAAAAVEENPVSLMPLANALTCYVMSASVATPEQANSISFGEASLTKDTLSNGTYSCSILEGMRLAALVKEETIELPNQRSRAFLKSFLCIGADKAKLLEAVQVRQPQVVAFSEKILAEYHRFSTHDCKYARQTAQEFRMHIAGEYDTVIWRSTGSTSKDAVSQFRARMRRVLLDNYPDGVQTIRNEFLRYLAADQRQALTEVLPELFSRP